MKTRLFFLLLILGSLFSCKRILLYAAGLRTPQEETIASLKKFAQEQGADTFDLYVAKDTAAFMKLNRIASSQSGYVFFDQNESMLLYKDTGQACSAPVIVFAKNICADGMPLYYKDHKTTLIKDLIIPITHASQNEMMYDRYAFIFWYKYFGKRKFQSDVVAILNDLRRSSCRVKVYLVNLDLKPGWKKLIPIKVKG